MTASFSLCPTLWVAEINDLPSSELFDRACGWLSEERQQHIRRLKHPADRYRSAAAALLLRHALCTAGIKPDRVRVEIGENGKPFLPDMPGFHFNLSHSGDFAICAVAHRDVGCDIQQKTTARLELAKRFFAPAEWAAIEAANETERQTLFFRYWALKESFLKATGRGLSLPLNAFEISLSPPTSVTQSVDTRSYSFAEFSEIEGYACAVCLAADTASCSLRRVSLREIL